MVALVIGFFGIFLSYSIGHLILDLSIFEISWGILVANIACLLALVFTLQIEKISWIREKVLNQSLKTWILLVAIYFLFLVGFAPQLRNFKNLMWLFVPLLMSEGIMILTVFGPIQDFIVKKTQMRMESRKFKQQSALESLEYKEDLCKI